MINFILWPIVSFLIGGIPSGLLIGKLFGEKDLRKKGSHNIGATNVFRALGAYPALLTLICDILKGIIPLIIVKGLHDNLLLLVFCGISAILGHDFSPYLKFRGGKGVATSLGVFLILSPKALFITLFFWILILLLSKIVSLASIGAGIFLPVALFFFSYPKQILFTGILASLVLIFRHKENILRIIKGEEKAIGKK